MIAFAGLEILFPAGEEGEHMIIKAYKAIIKEKKEQEVENFCTLHKEELRELYYDTKKIMNVNAFVSGRELYVYIESCQEEIFPDVLFSGVEAHLCLWPDGENKYFYPLTEIFRFHEPQSHEQWERKQKPDCCAALIAKIVPELTASYIFYHYQLQEEQPGNGDKYGRIFLMGDTTFFYREFPQVQETPSYQGKLNTQNTPPSDQWQSLMGEHFLFWDDSYETIDDSYDFKGEPYPENRKTNQWLYIKNILSIV